MTCELTIPKLIEAPNYILEKEPVHINLMESIKKWYDLRKA